MSISNVYADRTPPRPPALWLPDRHGVKYRFWQYSIYDLPSLHYCVYAFVSLGAIPIKYIGRAEDLSDRLVSHEKLSAAVWLGASQLWVHVPAAVDPIRYREVERRLIETYGPPLNVQHNDFGAFLAGTFSRNGWI